MTNFFPNPNKDLPEAWVCDPRDPAPRAGNGRSSRHDLWHVVDEFEGATGQRLRVHVTRLDRHSFKARIEKVDKAVLSCELAHGVGRTEAASILTALKRARETIQSMGQDVVIKGFRP
ncbi:MAG: hypothetical protein HY548_00790 [Elusimicrobia bacterium]|nr:hypothetical protein [Elusimicrobiota bacterium]